LSDGFNISLFGRTVLKCIPNGVDRFVEIVLLNDRVGPNCIDKFGFCYQAAAVSYKHDQRLKCFFGKRIVGNSIGPLKKMLADIQPVRAEFINFSVFFRHIAPENKTEEKRKAKFSKTERPDPRIPISSLSSKTNRLLAYEPFKKFSAERQAKTIDCCWQCDHERRL